MGKATQANLIELYESAEARGMCLVPTTQSLKTLLRRQVSRGLSISPYRGLYVRPSYWSTLKPDERARHAMRAYGVRHPDWRFCDVSAAVAHGLYISWRHCSSLHIQAPMGSGRHDGAGILWQYVSSSNGGVVDGMNVTTLDRTTVDCMRHLPFPEALGVADSWIRMTGKCRESLAQLVDAVGMGCKGVQNARRAASYADGASENGGESYARGVMIDLGYEPPSLQIEIPNPIDPGHISRVDYLWVLDDGTKVVGELDGFVKYTDPEMMGGLDSEQVRANERLRESRLSVPGVSVMRFSMADVCDAWRFRRILDEYGVPHAAGTRHEDPRRRRYTYYRPPGAEYSVRCCTLDRR